VPVAGELFQELLPRPGLGARLVGGLRVLLFGGGLLGPGRRTKGQQDEQHPEVRKRHGITPRVRGGAATPTWFYLLVREKSKVFLPGWTSQESSERELNLSGMTWRVSSIRFGGSSEGICFPVGLGQRISTRYLPGAGPFSAGMAYLPASM